MRRSRQTPSGPFPPPLGSQTGLPYGGAPRKQDGRGGEERPYPCCGQGPGFSRLGGPRDPRLARRTGEEAEESPFPGPRWNFDVGRGGDFGVFTDYPDRDQARAALYEYIDSSFPQSLSPTVIVGAGPCARPRKPTTRPSFRHSRGSGNPHYNHQPHS